MDGKSIDCCIGVLSRNRRDVDESIKSFSSIRCDVEVIGEEADDDDDDEDDDVRCRIKHVIRAVIFNIDINITVEITRILFNKIRR